MSTAMCRLISELSWFATSLPCNDPHKDESSIPERLDRSSASANPDEASTRRDGAYNPALPQHGESPVMSHGAARSRAHQDAPHPTQDRGEKTFDLARATYRILYDHVAAEAAKSSAVPRRFSMIRAATSYELARVAVLAHAHVCNLGTARDSKGGPHLRLVEPIDSDSAMRGGTPQRRTLGVSVIAGASTIHDEGHCAQVPLEAERGRMGMSRLMPRRGRAKIGEDLIAISAVVKGGELRVARPP